MGDVEVDGRRLRLTNLRKVMYPDAGFTKADVLHYYARVAPTADALLPSPDDALERVADSGDLFAPVLSLAQGLPG